MRADPRKDKTLLSALKQVAPGTPLRSGIDDIIRAEHGALIVIGDPNELAFLFSGGMRLDLPLTAQLLYELAKMDGAIVVSRDLQKLVYANVQLMPDASISTSETGTRHRTAERVAKQTDALVVSISQQRETVTVFVGDLRYQLGEISDTLARTNQALGTLETYRTRLDQGLTRLTALEFQSAVVLDDVLIVLQRAEMTTRMAEEIERNCVELGEEGRLIRMQLDELMEDVPREKAAVVYDYEKLRRSRVRRRPCSSASPRSTTHTCTSSRSSPSCSASAATRTRSTSACSRAGTACSRGSLASRTPSSGTSCATSGASTRSFGPATASSRRWTAWARCAPGRSARGSGASRSTISSIVTFSSNLALPALRGPAEPRSRGRKVPKVAFQAGFR